MTYRWLTEDEIISLVNPNLAHQGMPMLNTAVARVYGAFDGDRLIRTLTLQLFPLLGPLTTHDHTHRDNGEVSRTLANLMDAYLQESHARGYLAVCDSPVTERICERHGMKRIESPVFLAVGPPAVVH